MVPTYCQYNIIVSLAPILIHRQATEPWYMYKVILVAGEVAELLIPVYVVACTQLYHVIMYMYLGTF